jgi:hypothetical protein
MADRTSVVRFRSRPRVEKTAVKTLAARFSAIREKQ